jgi:hypothetical protein
MLKYFKGQPLLRPMQGELLAGIVVNENSVENTTK